MFPAKITWRDPQGLGSADAAGACRCDDGMEYALKDGASHPLTPHNEWFCTNLAEAVGVVCPPCKVIEDENGEFLFGSRWEGGLIKDVWWDPARSGSLSLDIIGPTLSRILAFDHFIHNVDRHIGNYIVREAKNNYIVMAFDFSRSWLYHNFPLPQLPFSPHDNTLYVARHLRGLLGDYIVLREVHEVLDRLASVSLQQVRGIIDRHPEVWLPPDRKAQILSWWETNERQQRIEAIREGIKDGTFL